MSLFEENAEVLRSLSARGVDLESPRVVDFSHVFPDRASAEAFAAAVRGNGFQTALREFDGEDPWDVTASRTLKPTCDDITETEARLGELAMAHGGRADGWGFLGA